MTQIFDVFLFDLRPDNRLSKQSRGRWFETPSHSLRCHCNEMYFHLTHNKKIMRLKHIWYFENRTRNYSDVIMDTIASQIISFTIFYSTVYSGTDQRKHQSSASLAFVREFTGDRWIPRTNASNAENVSIWWRHHGIKQMICRCTDNGIIDFMQLNSR